MSEKEVEDLEVKQEKTEKQESKKHKENIKDLKDKLKIFEKRLEEEKNYSHKLEQQIKEINDSYKNKIQTKTAEAQSLIEKKKQELENKYEKESTETKKYGIFKNVSGLITTLQTFEMVLSAPVEDPQLRAYLQGFGMIKETYKNALSDLGIEEINAKPGDDVDPSIHEAMELQESEEFKKGKITKILRKGYKLHDRVIEPVKVVVAK